MPALTKREENALFKLSKRTALGQTAGTVDGPMIEARGLQKVYDAGEVRVHALIPFWRAEILSASMDRSQDNDVRCQSDTREVLWKVRRSKPKGG